MVTENKQEIKRDGTPATEGELRATIQDLETQLKLANLENQILALKAQVATSVITKKSGLGGRKVSKPVLDTKTGKAYHAESAAGMAVAGEYPGLSATKKDGTKNSFVWYSIPDKDTRFRHLTQQEYQDILNKKTQPAQQVEVKPEVKVEKVNKGK